MSSSPSSSPLSAMLSPTLSTLSARPSPPSMLSMPSNARAVRYTVLVANCSLSGHYLDVRMQSVCDFYLW